MLHQISERQKEVLQLLSRYGVLGTKTIQMLVREATRYDCIRKTLKRMEEQDLICKVFTGSEGKPMAYWILPDDETAKGRALKATGLDPKFFRTKRVRYSHVPHESVCTLVHASLERQMPKLWIYRESTADFKNLPGHLISKNSEEQGNIPDLCVGVPGRNADPLISERGYRWIGVEVDRTNRSKVRIARRLNLYTKHTAFSGLLYLLPTPAALRSVREIFLKRTDKSAYRLRGASQSFLALGLCPENLFDVNAMRVWVGEHEIPLGTWISLFGLSEAHERDRVLLGPTGIMGRGA